MKMRMGMVGFSDEATSQTRSTRSSRTMGEANSG
jgi:hypothetical protein